MVSRRVVQENSRKSLHLTRLGAKKRLVSRPAAYRKWSGRRDSNSRPLAPHASALPGYATARTRERSARPAPRAEARANHADVAIASARGAVFAAKIYHPQVQLVPARLREQRLQVALRLPNVATTREPPALREPVNVRVDGERRDVEGLRHDDAGRLVAHTRQLLQLRERARHGAPVPLGDDLGQAGYRLRLLRRKPARPDDPLDLRNGSPRHPLRGVRHRKKLRGHLVHPLVGALRGEDDRDEQRERILVRERDRRLGVQRLQRPVDIGGTRQLRCKGTWSHLDLLTDISWIGNQTEGTPQGKTRLRGRDGRLPLNRMSAHSDLTDPTDSFARRHQGDDPAATAAMLAELKYPSVDALVDTAVPAHIRRGPLNLPGAAGESAALAELRAIASYNRVFRNFIGMGYSDAVVPGVIQRTILENPAWYTAYTPYQAEISQGRLEALLNFQTVVSDLTGLEIANASTLDEGTSAAEAMMMCHRLKESDAAEHRIFFVSDACHPQTIDIVRTRAKPLGIEIATGDHLSFKPGPGCFGVLVQYPDTWGTVRDYTAFFAEAHAAGAFCIVAADLLALALLRPPGEFGADVAVGSSQRFGVPPGFGGPHAGFLATRDAFKRQMPGRLVGVSRDAQGDPAMRLALGTREQHIRRDKATSNICTSQVLLAVMASMYAVYHGPGGLRRIARRTKLLD